MAHYTQTSPRRAALVTGGARSQSHAGNQVGQAGNDPDFVKAEYWIDFGRLIENRTTGELEFYGLPRGLPLDTMPMWKGFSYAMGAKKDNFHDMMAMAEELEPGEAIYIPTDCDMVIQLRRSKDKTEAEEERNATRKPANFRFRSLAELVERTDGAS